MKVLVLGSGPNVVTAQNWADHSFDCIIAINNAWRVRPDWNYLIHPSDFPTERMPQSRQLHQKFITYEDYVPAQNALGGFVYAGGTMAFTAGYWALNTLTPTIIAYIGCDMIYSKTQSHFYGRGKADPLRNDVTLRSLEAKSARLLAMGHRQDCRVVNLSTQESRLIFPRADIENTNVRSSLKPQAIEKALQMEAEANYFVPSGKYWKEEERFDPGIIDKIDAAWLATVTDT